MEGISQKHFLCVCKCAYAHKVNWNYLIVRVVQTSPSFMAEKSEAMTLSRRNVAFISFLLAVSILYTDLSNCSNEDSSIKEKNQNKASWLLTHACSQIPHCARFEFCKIFLYNGLNKQLR